MCIHVSLFAVRMGERMCIPTCVYMYVCVFFNVAINTKTDTRQDTPNANTHIHMFVLYACYVYLCICTKSTTTWVIVDLCACVRGHACDTPVACMYAQMQVPRMGNLCTHVGLSQALALNTKYSE